MNNDRLAASWALVAGSIAFGVWFWLLPRDRKDALLRRGSAPADPIGGRGSSGGSTRPSSGGSRSAPRAPARVIDPGGESFPWPLKGMLEAWGKKPRPGWPSGTPGINPSAYRDPEAELSSWLEV